MDFLEQRASGGLFLGLGEHPVRGIYLDRPAGDLAVGNTFLIFELICPSSPSSLRQLICLNRWVSAKTGSIARQLSGSKVLEFGLREIRLRP